jgi:hypothetical protein
MSIGSSGRVVIEIAPVTKRMLYSALARDGLTLKEWFLKCAERYLIRGPQLALPLPADENEQDAESAQVSGASADRKSL